MPYLTRSVLLYLLAVAAPGVRLGVDLQGNPIRQLTVPGARVVVLFFVATDCPVSDRYIPEVDRLRREFGSRGVTFWWVYPNPGDTAAMVREHQRHFAVEGGTILDSSQALVHMAHVRVTPEAAVFMVAGGSGGHAGEVLREVYRGRVDDRYLSFGKQRPRPGHHDLEEAISSALDGRAIVHPATPAVGCSIVPLPELPRVPLTGATARPAPGLSRRGVRLTDVPSAGIR